MNLEQTNSAFLLHFCQLQTLLLMYYDRLPYRPTDLQLDKNEIEEIMEG